MKEFGDFLKEARERRQLTLQQVQDQTKVRLRHLQSIEEGDFEGLPGEVYLRGFLRSYAVAVGLNPDEVIARYAEARKKEEPVSLSVAEQPAERPVQEVVRPERVRPVKVAKPPRRSRVFRVPAKTIRTAGLVLLAVVLVTVVAIGAWRFLGQGRSPARLPESRLSRSKTAPQNPTQKLKVRRVSVRAIQRCWAEVVVDGRLAYSDILSAGQTGEWSGKTISISLGNSGGVVLTVDGRDAGTPGQVGEPKTLRYSAE